VPVAESIGALAELKDEGKMAPIVEADASQPILDAARRHGVSPR
jgi:hypothetical protein